MLDKEAYRHPIDPSTWSHIISVRTEEEFEKLIKSLSGDYHTMHTNYSFGDQTCLMLGTIRYDDYNYRDEYRVCSTTIEIAQKKYPSIKIQTLKEYLKR